MRKHGFKKLDLLIIAAIAAATAGACSPVGTSVSKFSNTKASPINGALQGSTSNLPSNSISRATISEESAEQVTIVKSRSDFAKEWDDIQKHSSASFEFYDASPKIEALRTELIVNFRSDDIRSQSREKISKQEERLSSKSNAKIYVVIGRDKDEMTDHELGRIKVALNWNEEFVNASGSQWQMAITIDESGEDGSNKAKQLRELISNHLYKVAVEFNAK